MYFIGIDISKYKHDCSVIDSDGFVVTPSWSFSNDREGFSILLSFLNELDGEIRIGFEATGHYGLNLKLFLEANNFTFMEFNSVLIKRFVSGKSLRQTKTDSLDAFNIAQYLMTVEYKPYPKSFYHYDALKSLTRFRSGLMKRRSKYLLDLTNVLDLIFPEFKPFFNNEFGPTAMYILSHYGTPEKIANMNSKSFEALRSVSKGKFSASRFAELKLLAKNSIGNSNDYSTLEMNILLDLYVQISSKISELESEIQQLVLNINPPMLSIPGIGINSAAVILAECGNFSRFENAGKLLSFAGMEPGFYQSGTSVSKGHMVKRGSPYLRYTIISCCLPAINCNPVFAEYYAKKRAEGKPHRVAITHVAKKLVRVIYTLETKNTTYSKHFAR